MIDFSFAYKRLDARLGAGAVKSRSSKVKVCQGFDPGRLTLLYSEFVVFGAK
jgi:hypothetical protein